MCSRCKADWVEGMSVLWSSRFDGFEVKGTVASVHAGALLIDVEPPGRFFLLCYECEPCGPRDSLDPEEFDLIPLY